MYFISKNWLTIVLIGLVLVVLTQLNKLITELLPISQTSNSVNSLFGNF